MILDFLRESICQSRKTSHGHTHGEVLPLDVTGRDMAGIRLPSDSRSHRPNAFSGAIPLLRLGAIAVQLDQHRVVNIVSKGILNRLQIYTVSVRSKLNA